MNQNSSVDAIDSDLTSPVEDEAHAPVPLSRRARSAIGWNLGFNVFRDLLQFGMMLVLVRLIPPQEYGRFSLTNSVLGFASVFSIGSVLAHSLQVRRDEEVDYQAHFTVGGAIQISLFVLLNLVTLGLHRSETYGPVAPLVHVMSLSLLLEWPTELRRKMLERSLDWRRLRLVHAVGLLASAGLAIVMALAGAGVWALLVPGMLVTVPFIVDLFFVQSWRPTWKTGGTAFRPAIRFGLKRMGSGLLAKGKLLAESSMVASLFTFASLGYYGRAIGLGQMLCEKLAFQVMYSVYPVLTRVEPRSERYVRAAGLVLRSLAWVVVPTATILAILASPVVELVYGSRWMPVVPLLPVALLLAVSSALYHVCYTLLLGNMRERLCLELDAVVFGAVLVLLFFVLPAGLRTYLAAVAALYCALFFVALALLVRDRGLDVRGARDALVPAICAAALSGGAILAAREWIPWWPEGAVELAANGILFGVCYVTVLRAFFSRPLPEPLSHVPASHAALRLFGFRRHDAEARR